jgi:hypothetical protein
MSWFLYVVAVGVPVSTAVCLLHAVIRRRFDLVQGGLPVLAATAVLGLVLIGALN